ncbi:MAG: thioredoxin family protein [Candidatus Marinimicrobia bacterium]|nr:thioredoxin family protein [Candidatus Neomarinimicrobiota bacterium]
MFLREDDKEFVKGKLSQMDSRVKIVYFTQELECQFCKETRQLLEEIVELSDKLDLEVFNFQIDKDKAQRYGIDKIPAIAMVKEDGMDYGIRFYGIPSGYEFMSLLEDIIDVSNGEHSFNKEQLEEITSITKPVHIQVFVTPTCPYCPSAVRIAHRLAIASDEIKADMVEVTEFPYLATKYNVRGVPKSIINESVSIEGAVPESVFISKVKEAVS